MDKRNIRFYFKFMEWGVENVRDIAIPDKLRIMGILTKEERQDLIQDLSTYKQRSDFWEIMTTKDYEHIPTLIQILEEVYGSGHGKTIGQMKDYLREADPELAQRLSVNSLATMTPTPGPSAESDYKFKVNKAMVIPIVDAICGDTTAMDKWSGSEAYLDFLTETVYTLKISRSLKRDEFHEAVSITINCWLSEHGGTFQDLLNIFTKHKMTKLIEKLKDQAPTISKMRES